MAPVYVTSKWGIRILKVHKKQKKDQLFLVGMLSNWQKICYFAKMPFGKLPTGKMPSWETTLWEPADGKLPLGTRRWETALIVILILLS